jgi:hypothetical protein
VGLFGYKEQGLDSKDEEKLNFVFMIAGQHLAFEVVVRDYEQEYKDAAVSMQSADIKRLDADELKKRLSFWPQKNEDSEIEALKDQ